MACCWTAAVEDQLMLPRCGLQGSVRLEWGSLDGGGADEDGGGTALWGIAPSKPEGYRWATTHAAGSLPRRSGAGEIQALAAMALSVAIRCGPCIRAYVQMAHEKGITQAELIEFLEVAMTMQGCPGEEWALKAYAAFKECAQGAASTAGMTCCPHQAP